MTSRATTTCCCRSARTAAPVFVTLATFSNCDSSSYVANSYTLSAAQFGIATEVQLVVAPGQAFEGGGGETDNFYADNVQFTATGRLTGTVAGAAPPNLVTLVDLLPAESATIVVNTTVNNPYTATDELTNIATVRSGNQVARASVIDCVRCFDYSDDPSSYNGSGGLAPARACTTSPRTYVSDTFQAGGYTGSTGTAAWSGPCGPRPVTTPWPPPGSCRTLSTPRRGAPGSGALAP